MHEKPAQAPQCAIHRQSFDQPHRGADPQDSLGHEGVGKHGALRWRAPDPDTCLSYPRHAHPADAVEPRDKIRPVFDSLRALRFMDETFYLRAGSLNIFNGMVGLTFSCDGSHYLPWDEFLSKGYDFWASGKALG